VSFVYVSVVLCIVVVFYRYVYKGVVFSILVWVLLS
jgi:hypothetical protein